MKKIIVFISVTAFATATFSNPFVSDRSKEEMAKQVIASLRNGSLESYLLLFPTLKEFHSVMDEFAYVYDDNLATAKEEFASRYAQEILPSINKSFTAILQEGKRKGIDWSKITFVRVEGIDPSGIFISAPIVIVFSVNDKEYRIIMDKALILHDAWRAGPKVSLI